ncbi:MAG: class I SAM-dependent methyltransferase [Planctomycetota bacterium]
MPPAALLERMSGAVTAHECAEMALPSYLHRNPALRGMVRWRLALLSRRLRRRAHPGCRVLDFGCGCGVLFRDAAAVAETVYGVDPVLEPARMLVDHYRLENVRLLTPDAAAREIAPASLDVVICAEVLEHIEDLGGTLGAIREQMKPAAHLLVTLPTENRLYRLGRRLAGFTGEYHCSNAARVHRRITDAGFRSLRRRSIPLPGPFAIYWAIDYRRE